jgi:phosphatidylethanolamine/phosphatidyl-N-methylethanolamine N-methyltransferase
VITVPINTNAWNRFRYTLAAPVYDLVAHFGRQRRRSIDLLILKPGERVLLSGAGTGADLPCIPVGVEIAAVDITPAMVDRLASRAELLGVPVDARVMDAGSLDFADASFDAVILHLILAVIPDPVACIREAERVLKPGGRAVVFDKWVADEKEPSLRRRLANLVTNTVATDITRKLGPLVAETSLRIEHREAAGLGRLFDIALLRKPDQSPLNPAAASAAARSPDSIAPSM